MNGLRATFAALGLSLALFTAQGAAAQPDGAASPGAPPPGSPPSPGAGTPGSGQGLILPPGRPYEPLKGGPEEEPNANPREFRGIWIDTGHWAGFSLGPNPPLTPSAQKALARHRELSARGTSAASAHLTCRPSGIDATLHPRATVTVMQSPSEIVIISEEDRNVRRIRLNQKHPALLTPTYMGDSVGVWDGNMLVVDTVGYNGMGWMDEKGIPHSDQLHVVERISKSADGQQLQFEVTFTDPETFTQPYVIKRAWAWASGARPQEYDCEESPSGLGILTYDNEAFRPVCNMSGGAGDSLPHVQCVAPNAK